LKSIEITTLCCPKTIEISNDKRRFVLLKASKTPGQPLKKDKLTLVRSVIEIVNEKSMAHATDTLKNSPVISQKD
jgi:hypothetical protein